MNITPCPNTKLIVDEDGLETELVLFQVDYGVFQIMDVQAANRYVNDKIEQNSNWTFDDYARLVDSPHSELIRIEQNSVVYTRNVKTELKAENPKQHIPPERKMRLVLEGLSLTLFQVSPNRFQLFDVDDGNRWNDIVKEGNANFTWEDYVDWIGACAGELIEITTENNTYRRTH